MGREKSLREVNKFYWPISKDEEFSEEKSLIDSRQQFKFPSLCRLEANSEMFYDKFVCWIKKKLRDSKFYLLQLTFCNKIAFKISENKAKLFRIL